MACKDINASFTGSHPSAPLYFRIPELRFSVLGPQENPQDSTELHDAGKKQKSCSKTEQKLIGAL